MAGPCPPLPGFPRASRYSRDRQPPPVEPEVHGLCTPRALCSQDLPGHCQQAGHLSDLVSSKMIISA